MVIMVDVTVSECSTCSIRNGAVVANTCNLTCPAAAPAAASAESETSIAADGTDFIKVHME